MDTRLLQSVVIAGEELHYEAAAERLGISIRRLKSNLDIIERQYGERLFIADDHGLQPTATGIYFIEIARKRLLQAHLAMHDGMTKEPKPGYCLAYAPHTNPVLLASVRKLSERFGVRPALFSVASGEQLELLQRGVFQAGLTVEIAAAVGIQLSPMFMERLSVVLPAEHELARRGQPVQLAELRETPLIGLSRPYAHLNKRLQQACQNAGLKPRPGPMAGCLAEAVLLAGGGEGFCLARDCERRYARAGAVFLPLTESLWIATMLAFRSGCRDEFTAALSSAPLPIAARGVGVRGPLSNASNA